MVFWILLIAAALVGDRLMVARSAGRQRLAVSGAPAEKPLKPPVPPRPLWDRLLQDVLLIAFAFPWLFSAWLGTVQGRLPDRPLMILLLSLATGLLGTLIWSILHWRSAPRRARHGLWWLAFIFWLSLLVF